MPRTTTAEDWESDYEDEDDVPPYDGDGENNLPEGVYFDDEWATVPCPYCREEIAEESQQCPKCGKYLSKEDSTSEPKNNFWVGMMVLAILCVVVLALIG